MPSQLRRLIRAQGRDLHAEFLQVLPYQLPPVKIQRWSLRRIGLMCLVVVILVFAVIITVQLFQSPI
jgi:hypothetical protein